MKGRMLAQIYSATPMTAVALLLFFGAFVAIVYWVYFRSGAKSEYEEMARLPLTETGESYE